MDYPLVPFAGSSFALQVEREHEVALHVLLRDHVLDVDVEAVGLIGMSVRGAGHSADPRLVLVQRLFAIHLGARRGDVVIGREHQVVDATAEVGAAQALAGGRAQDDEDRLADVLLELRGRHATVEVDRHRKPEALTKEVAFVHINNAPRSRREPSLDELLALAARDLGRVVDLLDRERAMVAVRARDLAGSPSGDHVEHVLPCDEGFLVHRESPFVSTPFEGSES
jgi:hypothetical protein